MGRGARRSRTNLLRCRRSHTGHRRGLFWIGGAGPPRRLRQRHQPAADARGRTPRRAGCPPGHGRIASAAGPPDAHRDDPDRAGRTGRCVGPGLGDGPGDRQHSRRHGHPGAARSRVRRPDLRARRDGGARRRPALRACTGHLRHPSWPFRRAARRRPGPGGQPAHPAVPRRAGCGPGRRVGDAGHGGTALHSEHQARLEPRSGVPAGANTHGDFQSEPHAPRSDLDPPGLRPDHDGGAPAPGSGVGGLGQLAAAVSEQRALARVCGRPGRSDRSHRSRWSSSTRQSVRTTS